MKRSLGLFSIAAVLPLVVVGVGMGTWALRNQRLAIEQRAEDHAGFVATLIGREMAANIHSTQMISQSPGLDADLDAERLLTLGRRLVADEPSWRAISVASADGTRLLDAPEPIGGVTGGKVIDMVSLERAVTTKTPTVGRVVIGPRGRAGFAVRAPVVRDGEVDYVVSTVVDPAALSNLLLANTLPKGWTVEVVDGAGAIVAVSGADPAIAGRPAPQAALQARMAGETDFYRGEGPSGHEEVAIWRRVPNSDWTVHVAMPASAYAAPALQASRVLIIGSLISLLLSGLLAWLLVRQLQQHRQQEAAALESQRLEALGQMTGGVAHDFNNLLTPILGGLDLLRPRLEHDPRALRLVEAAIVSAERARALVSRLLTFARRQDLAARDVDVSGLLSGLVELLERSVGPKVAVTIDLPVDLPTARVDPAQLELAVLNLAVNARDAMPKGGTLSVTANEATVEPARNLDLSPGRYVRISVADTGVGMDAMTLRRAVEPFFTTKPQDRGTGLGLSMVHGLAAQSGGALRLYSEPGQGTRAEIWLPAGLAPAEAAAEIEVLADDRTARLLLVDDDDLARSSTAAVLRDHGHSVAEANSAREALALLHAGEPVDVMITDYAMPAKTGAELIREARLGRPGLPVLLITGFANYSEALPGDVIRLAKPFRRVELLNRVARLIPSEARTKGEVA